ncbi:SLC13 family permease, partial [Streptomyces rubiginosohelvolus]
AVDLLGKGGQHVIYGRSGNGHPFSPTEDEREARGITSENVLGPGLFRKGGGPRALETRALAEAAAGRLRPAIQSYPLARAATALKVDASDIFVPMIPALAVGLLFVIALSYGLGLRERKRLGVLTLDEVTAGDPEQVLVGAGSGGKGAKGRKSVKAALTGGGSGSGTDAEAPSSNGTGSSDASSHEGEDDDEFKGLDPHRATLRPKLYWFNAALTVALLALMVTETMPIPVLFLLAAAVALTVNFPNMNDQKARVAAHAENVVNVSGMVFAAAVFTGVLTGTGMVEHMARWLVDGVPEGMGPHMAIVTGVLSLPLTYFMSNDGFYFGIVPILAEAGAAHGVSALEIARASLVGQALHMSSPLVPAVYVLVGMAKVEFGDHTRFTVKWAALTSLVVLAAGLAFGII